MHENILLPPDMMGELYELKSLAVLPKYLMLQRYLYHSERRFSMSQRFWRRHECLHRWPGLCISANELSMLWLLFRHDRQLFQL